MIQVHTCHRDDNFVADTGYIYGDRQYIWIRLPGYMLSANAALWMHDHALVLALYTS